MSDLPHYASVGVFLTWFFLTLTTFRITRFITTDDLSEPFRKAVDRRFGPNSNWATLVNCGWCSSLYVCVPLFVLAAQVMNVPLPALQVGAALAVIGLLSNSDD